MLSRLERASEEVLPLLDAYDFAGAVKALYSLIWNDVCDWYLEAAKSRLYGDDQPRAATSRRRCCGCWSGCCASPTRCCRS